EITAAKAAQNLKPAKNTKPHHRGGTIRQIQPITYIIGINKLGTLLSSQTTDTPGTTQTLTFRIAPEQLFKLTRSPAPKQIHLSGPTSKRRPPQPIASALKSNQNLALIWGFWPPGEQFFTVSPAAT
ncbi:hypothetical protein, partial [Pseudarthrobacter niigatensis]|uniref:hypothetical protein n=1 Tax=Pseudarthrobacter niigatensis TaxID=369935 RepID=UPI0027D7AF02